MTWVLRAFGQSEPAAQSGDVAVSFLGQPNSPISHSAALLCLVAAGVDIPNSAKVVSYHSDGRGLRLGVRRMDD